MVIRFKKKEKGEPFGMQMSCPVGPEKGKKENGGGRDNLLKTIWLASLRSGRPLRRRETPLKQLGKNRADRPLTARPKTR